MTAPALASTRAQLAELLADRVPIGDQRVVLVPTMGALHEGHASLLREARKAAGDGPVVASVFVNPLQFGQGEDLDRYPRTLEQDLEVCAAEEVDVVFAPAVAEVYPGWPARPQVTVDPGPVAELLEGKHRPGHFRGVLTVVAKLFGLVRPDAAVFGEKDYQQLVLIRRMVADLCLTGRHGPLEIIGAETVREADGLALSSRNQYLDPEQRQQAVALNLALRAAKEVAVYGPEVALDAARAELRHARGVDLDYLELTTPELDRLPDRVPDGTEGRILIAARVGATRLIDNLALTFGDTYEGSAE